jgi:putative DNA methylase
VDEARDRVRNDAITAGLLHDEQGLDAGGVGAKAYADALSVYLAMAVSKETVSLVSLARWRAGEGKSAPAFGRQAIPIVWDFADLNPFAGAGGDFIGILDGSERVLRASPNTTRGVVEQRDAQKQDLSHWNFISTDPPYYDNIGYSDLGDYFYVWLRITLRSTFPALFATRATPKAEELVAAKYRHGSDDAAEQFFLRGMTQALRNLSGQAHPSAPITIYYAFKQSETENDSGTSSTGWETFLDAVLMSGLALTGTWPMRTESSSRMRGMGSNALASSVILVCRLRAKDAGTISRRQFVRLLNEALPLALDAMTRESEGEHSPVAPVDLSQAIIGPGMAIFSRYDAVLEADGTPMTVKTALQLINRFLAEDDFDSDTQFCLRWFEQHHWDSGQFGEADVLARAKGTSVSGVKASGVIDAGGGSVRLLKWKEYPSDWVPENDNRLPVWEALHQLIRAFNTEGDRGAAKVLAGVATKAEAARQLAYRLYTLCERANMAEDARAYNEVVTGWSGIESAAVKVATPQQRSLFDIEESR